MGQAAFVILGGGPVALACALWCVRSGPVRVLYIRARGQCASVPRIEVVPMATVAGLVELGVHPHSIGVFGFEERRLLAWESADPVAVVTAAAAHLERTALDRALLALAMRQPHIEFCCVDPATVQAEAAVMARAGACVIDATGRRAALAARTMRPRRPWVARMFHVSCKTMMLSVDQSEPFMAAALPQGYVFRAAGRGYCTVGVVGRGAMLAGGPADVRERLRADGAGWLIEDIAALQWIPAGAKPASIQWTESDAAALIGDAALSRDALSSQGLASGLADARYAAAIRSRHDRHALAQRSRFARAAHAGELVEMIAKCRWRGHAAWREYRGFLVESALAP